MLRYIAVRVLKVKEVFANRRRWIEVPQYPLDSSSIEDPGWKQPISGARRRRFWRIAFYVLAVSILITTAYIFRDVRLQRAPRYVYPVYRIQLEVTGPDPFFYEPVGNDHRPKIAPYNEPPANRPKTPLFISFTRNYKMLEQAVVSYIAAGWPREDIIVVDNSGTMNANAEGLLSRDNPFYLDYETLLRRYGVSILRTPTLLTFSQLQNFYIANSMARNWKWFFWGHSDVAIVSEEKREPYKSAYQNILDDLNALVRENANDPEHWAIRWYHYDWLTLVNTAAMKNVGSWDPFIPYYISDCEFNDRVYLAGMNISENKAVGAIYDLAKQIPDMEKLFFPQPGEAEVPGSPRYIKLRETLQKHQDEKYAQKGGRNTWQSEQTGGWGEPWTYNPKGFQRAWWMYSDLGKKIYKEKWGIPNCGLVKAGLRTEDAWNKP